LICAGILASGYEDGELFEHLLVASLPNVKDEPRPWLARLLQQQET